MLPNGLAKRSAEVRHLREQWASWRAGQFPSANEAKAFGFAFSFFVQS